MARTLLWGPLALTLVLAGCTMPLSEAAGKLREAQADIAYYEDRVEQARLDGDDRALEIAERMLEAAEAEAGRLADIAASEVGKGGPEDAQWLGAVGRVIGEYGGPLGPIGLIFGGLAEWRRREWKKTASVVVDSIDRAGVLSEASADQMKAIKAVQGPKHTGRVKKLKSNTATT